jgi:hypothetical protein
VDLFRQTEDRAGLVRALTDLGCGTAFTGSPAEGQTILVEALELARCGSDAWVHAYALHGLAQVLFISHEVAAADAYARQAVPIWRAIGDRRGLAHGLIQLCLSTRRQGNLARRWSRREKASSCLPSSASHGG